MSRLRNKKINFYHTLFPKGLTEYRLEGDGATCCISSGSVLFENVKKQYLGTKIHHNLELLSNKDAQLIALYLLHQQIH